VSLKQQIDADLKTAMLGGDKTLVTTLRGLKSAILYTEVAQGSRERGLTDDQVIEVLTKEAKKRQESADLYKQGQNQEKAEAELTEKAVIEKYLPEQMNETDIDTLVVAAIKETGATNLQQMGQVMAKVREQTKGQADGAIIARLVKDKLQ
jgi:hypothetical protein